MFFKQQALRWWPLLVALFGLTCVDAASLAAQTNAAAAPTGQGTSEAAVLQLIDDAEVASAIIRVRDVVQPVGPPPAGWESLAEASLGLIPRDGRRLRMERQRIAESIQHSGILQAGIRWTGPATVSIRYVESRQPAPTSHAAHHPTSTATRPAAGNYRQAPAAAGYPNRVAQTAAVTAAYEEPRSVNPAIAYESSSSAKPIAPLLPAERNRIERLILNAFQQTHADLLEKFEVQLVSTDPGVNQLEGLRGVNTLRLVDPPLAGTVRLAVNGDKELAPVEAIVKLDMLPLPTVVATTQALNRGDVLTSRDLQTITIPRNRLNNRHLTDMKDAIGKELNRPISRDRPLTLDDISEPIVIDRNETVELRVTGAGVQITTAAKALGPAAMGETIMLETINGRRRLMARAIAPGVAEILTRPPQIRNE